MSQYYTPHLIGENIYHIYEPGGVYTTLIIGSQKALLIDTGYGYGDLKKAVEALTDLPLIVVNTHGHFDHAGGNYQFNSVYINKDELPTYFWYLTEVKPLTTFWYLTEVKPLTTKTLLAKRSEDGLSVIPPELDIDWYLKQNNRHFEMLSNHHVFDLGGRMVEAIFLPGHTRGSVVFYDDLSGLLMSGDDISPNLWIQFEQSAPLYDYAADLISLKKLPLSGIVSSHIGYVMPPQLIDWINLWIQFEQSAPLYDYAADLISLKKLPLSGIVSSHIGYVMPPQLIDWIEFAIASIDDKKAKVFVHPRTGRRTQLFKIFVDDEAMKPIKKIHIIYDKNHKFSEDE